MPDLGPKPTSTKQGSQLSFTPRFGGAATRALDSRDESSASVFLLASVPIALEGRPLSRTCALISSHANVPAS
eukprot:869463-Amphidinium_carterae.1